MNIKDRNDKEKLIEIYETTKLNLEQEVQALEKALNNKKTGSKRLFYILFLCLIVTII